LCALSDTGESVQLVAHALSTAHFAHQVDGVKSSLGRLLVFEVSKYIAACGHMLPDAVNHRTALFPRITWLAETVVHEGRGWNIGRVHGLGFGHAQGGTTRL